MWGLFRVGLLLRLLAIALFALLASGYSYAEYGVFGTSASESRFNSLSADWFQTYGVTVVYSDGNTYEITFADGNLALVSEALSALGTTWVSTTSGCEAYYISPGTLGGVDYCVKNCGVSSYWCLRNDCLTYYYGNFAHYASNKMCTSCSFRSSAVNYYTTNCTDPLCYSGSYSGRKFHWEFENPFSPGACGYSLKYCMYQNYSSSCSGGCTNDCSSGQLRCYGSYTQTCGNYDADSCYEWPISGDGAGSTYCTYGCSGGSCISDPCAGVTCSNYCSGNVRYYSGSCSGGTCGSYTSENCDALDGYACNGNVREYRNYYCAPSACAYTVDQSTNCDTLDVYGNWEYYCSGSQRKKHRLFYNYSCGGSNCSSAAPVYADDALVENCAYGCTAGMCNGCSASITVDVEDWYDNPVVNASVHLDGAPQGTTGADGRILLSASASSCPATHAVRVVAQGGIDCTTKNVTNRSAGDNKFMMFTCNVQQPQLKMGIASGDPHYLGDDMTFGVEVKDSANSLISGANVGIWDPLKQMKVWKTTLAGIVEYLTQASRTGYFTFLFSATKPGYKAGSAEKGVLVKGFGEIVVNAQAKDGTPIAGASVKIDGASLGSTDAQGKFAVEMGQGTHTVEVCANGYCMSKGTEITHNGDVDELRFVCDECASRGTLNVEVVNATGRAILNAVVLLDDRYSGVTEFSLDSNTYSSLKIAKVPYGSHTLIASVYTDPDCGTQSVLSRSQGVTLNEKYKDVVLALDIDDASSYALMDSNTLAYYGSTEYSTQDMGLTAGFVIITLGMYLSEVSAMFTNHIVGQALSMLMIHETSECIKGSEEGCVGAAATIAAPAVGSGVAKVCGASAGYVSKSGAFKTAWSGLETFFVRKLGTMVVEGIEYSFVKVLGSRVLVQTEKGTVISIKEELLPTLKKYIEASVRTGHGDPLRLTNEFKLVRMMKAPGISTQIGTETIDGVAVLREGTEEWGLKHMQLEGHIEHIKKAFGLTDEDAALNFIEEALEKGKVRTGATGEPTIIYEQADEILRVSFSKKSPGSIQSAHPE